MMKKELVSFVPKPNTLGTHNWCVPYAWATLLGKDYDDVYKDICDCLGRRFEEFIPARNTPLQNTLARMAPGLSVMRFLLSMVADQ